MRRGQRGDQEMTISHHKDYYRILGVQPEASGEEIKRAYRTLAFRYHPDRNPYDRENAEKQFKEITEAYGVLMDPGKRGEYDRLRSQGAEAHQRTSTGRSRGFAFNYEDILRDIFNDPEASRIFRDMQREFGSRGVRFDQRFFDNLFFGGRGMFVGGVFFFGPHARRRAHHGGGLGQKAFTGGQAARDLESFTPKPRESLLRKAGRKLHELAWGGTGASRGKPARGRHDLRYTLTVSPQEARAGTEVAIAYRRGEEEERLSVKVPPGTKPGTLLRLRGKGLQSKSGKSGDLYLKIHVSG
jgi:DnaJ-class molecular chaperone